MQYKFDPQRVLTKLTQHESPLVRESAKAATLEVAVEDLAAENHRLGQENSALREALDQTDPQEPTDNDR
jgi:regulator of replication initiation timing